jgi:FlaA1/EpsC-like NDP-sugar epimerase
VRPYNRRLYAELTRSADALVMLGVFGAVFIAVNTTEAASLLDLLAPRLSLRNVLLLAGLALGWQTLFALFGLYDASEPVPFRAEVPSIAASCTLGTLLSLPLLVSSRSGAFDLRVVLPAWPLVTAATVAARYGLRKVAERARRGGARRVLIAGSGPLALHLYEQLRDNAAAEYEILGFVDTNPDVRYPEIRARVLGSLGDTERILMHTVVDEVLVALPVKSCYADIQHLIEVCERRTVAL